MGEKKILKAKDYTSPELFKLELERIFKFSWHYVGHVDQVATPGQHFATVANNTRIIVVRAMDHTLKAYINVCKHRGSEIIRHGESGQSKLLTCHLHGWFWDLNGEFQGGPFSREEKPQKAKKLALKSLNVQCLGPFLFVAFEHDVLPWKGVTKVLGKQLADPKLGLHQLRFKERRTYAAAANWKLVIENNLESQACVLWPRRAQSKKSVKWGANRKNKDPMCMNNCLWPFFLLKLDPGSKNASVHVVQPISEGHTLIHCDYYLSEDASEDHGVVWMHFMDRVQRDDIEAMEEAQEKLAREPRPTSHTQEQRDRGISHFQALVKDFLAGRYSGRLQKV